MNRLTRLFVLLAPLMPMAAGCYNVDGIKNGGLACASNYVCPDGYGCRNGRCYKNGTDGGSSPSPDSDVGGLCPAPFGPIAGCSRSVESGSTCDPVCQTDCACNQRCHLSNTSFACQAVTATSFLAEYQACQTNEGDTCRPGTICLAEAESACGAHCYRFCREDGDCPTGSRCRDAIAIGDASVSSKVLTCSPPITTCNPIGSADSTRCTDAGFACYVFGATDPEQTTCECAGTIQAGGKCSQPHTCVPGYECVNSVCRRLCLLQASSNPACGAGRCVSVFGSTRYGTCQ